MKRTSFCIMLIILALGVLLSCSPESGSKKEDSHIFYVDEAGTLHVSDKSKIQGEITIPEKVDGVRVIAISENAFSN